METEIILMMEKDKEGNFLKEIDSYTIEKSDLVNGLYAINEDKLNVYIILSTDRDVENWEFDAIYDWFNLDNLKEFYIGVQDMDDVYNPSFKFKLSFEENMEEKLNKFIELYYEELLKTYDEIINHKEEYN